MRCPRCQTENDAGARFCEDCGARLEATCPSCGTPVTSGKKFCRSCGAALTTEPAGRFASPESYTPKHIAEKILTSRQTLIGERKQVSVVFCDLVGSTSLAERLGPEAMHVLLSRFFELVLTEVHRFEGTINQFLGDGFMALFGAPIAHEDHARRAVLAALAVQRALQETAQDLRPGTGKLVVRVGINTGPVVVGAIGDDLRMDYTAVGDTTNLAARLQQLAAPGTILISDATARLIRRDILLEPLGPFEIRGKSTPVPAYRVVGTRRRRSPFADSEGRRLSPFVGRDRELAALLDLVALAEAGQGQVVSIVGEPGVGKSRLIHELAQSLRSRRVTWLEGHCLSYGSTVPYLPILDILRGAQDIGEDDSPADIAAKLHAGLDEVGVSPSEALPYLLHLLDIKEGAETVAQLPPDVIKPRTFRILRELSVKGAHRRPLIFIIEDVHWIDRSSEEYLGTLVESLAGAPLLLLTTSRPGYRPSGMQYSYATQIVVRPLAAHDSRLLANSVAAGALTEQLADMILRRAEGNPFFVEELTQSALERHAEDIPEGIHAVLAARIDRLAPETKALLQTAAILGRDFSELMLGAIWDGGELTQHLVELRRREFVYERRASQGTVHVFKHALTQDVAYDSLLEARRRELHARVVKVIEQLHAERLDEHVDDLAYHAFRGGVWDGAAAYARRAGLRALARSANREAAALFDQGLAALEHLPESRTKSELAIDLRLDLKSALVPLGELGRAFEPLEEAEGRARSLNDLQRLGPVLIARCHGFWVHTGDALQAVEFARQGSSVAATIGDPALQIVANFYLGVTHGDFGDYASAIKFLEQCVAGSESVSVRDRLGFAGVPAVMARAFLARFLAAIGHTSQALTVADEAIRVGELADHPYSLSLALWAAGLAAVTRGDVADAESKLARGLALCEESRLAFVWPIVAALLGWARTFSARPHEGLSLLDESYRRAGSIGFRMAQALIEAYRIEAYAFAERVEAEQLARGALTLVTTCHARGYEAMIRRVTADLAARRDVGGAADAERGYYDVLKLADELGMRPLVAHCHVGLGKLYRRMGKRQEAQEHLSTATTMYREMDMRFWLEKAAVETAAL